MEHLLLDEGFRPRDTLPGLILDDRYEVLEKLAEGGMGCVFSAFDAVERTPVAVKVLHSEAASNPNLHRRFLNECRATMSIVSEHVVEITDFGVLDDGSAFYVMEYLDGESLHDFRFGSFADLQRIVLQVCDGLVAAHDRGVIHRDLKPENVVVSLTDDGAPLCKVIDFGIAKLPFITNRTQLTVPGQVMGTPAYIAPEQVVADAPVDHRCDIYSLGVVMYELVTDRVPFLDSDPIMLALAHISREPTPVCELNPDCPEGLEQVIMRCLEKDPDDRFPDVAALAEAMWSIEFPDVVVHQESAAVKRDGATLAMEELVEEDPESDALTIAIDRLTPEPEPWVDSPPPSTTQPGVSIWAWVALAMWLIVAVIVMTWL